MIKKLSLLFSIIFFIVLISSESKAASLYMDPNETEIGPGGSIIIDLIIDVDDECINTVDVYIDFDLQYLKLEDFLIGNSIINIWLEKPETSNFSQINDTGSMHISGGIPGGYCGKIPGDPGDPKQSSLVGRMIFKMPAMIVVDEKKEFLEIRVRENSKVLINDGFGTEDSVNIKNALVKVLEVKNNEGNEWKRELEEDNIKPNPFVIELREDPGIFEGKYYLNFFTTDKQSGMDYYEVLEIRSGEEVGVVPKSDILDRFLGLDRPAPVWKIAKIPYLLEDQSLQSIIKVKARDKAGNERIVEYLPDPTRPIKPVKVPIYQNKIAVLIFISTVSAIFGLLLVIMVIRIVKKLNKKKYEEE